jgi:SAM-dependent methyltransferase
MSAPPGPGESRSATPPHATAADVQERWNTNAGWWDDTVGDGNATQRLILGPATERLLGPVRGRRLLDIACGNGHFARRLADLGAEVVAVDFSDAFLERARARSTAYADRIEFRHLDATNGSELRGLGAGSYDAAVCTMALMDMTETRPLFEALAELLRPDAPFVFSVTHPAFNQTGATRGLEEVEGPHGLEERPYVRVDRYRTGGPGLGTGIVGQPVGHWYFERSLTELLAPAFAAGFAVDALEELSTPPTLPAARPLAWSKFPEIPPFLIVRVRRAPGAAP